MFDLLSLFTQDDRVMQNNTNSRSVCFISSVVFWLSVIDLEFVFPHHTLNGFYGAVSILRIFFLVVLVYHFAIYREINELAHWHACIYAHRVHTAYFQRPGVAKPYIAFASSGVYVYPQASGRRFTFQEGHMCMRFGIFFRYAQVQGTRLQYIALCRYFEVRYLVMFLCI